MEETKNLNNEYSNDNQKSDEIDLRELFFLIREGIIKAWECLISYLVVIFKFFKKNILYLIIGSLLSLGVALFSYSSFSSQKIYKMVVSPNDVSRMFLYDKIKYYGENQEREGFTIVISPIKDYKESTEIVLEKLNLDDKDILEKIDLEQFISSIKDFEYRNHIISIYSDQEIDIDEVQKMIVSTIENSSLIKKRQKEELEILNAERERIEVNLNNIDQTIKKNLQSEAPKVPSNSVLIENASKADVFNTYQQLSDELSQIEREIDKQKEVLKILSSLSFFGETQFSDNLSHLKPKKSSIVISFGKIVLLGFMLTIFLILSLNTLRYFIKRAA